MLLFHFLQLFHFLSNQYDVIKPSIKKTLQFLKKYNLNAMTEYTEIYAVSCLPFIKANFDIRDVRLMYEGLSFYLQNENQEPDDYDRIMKIKNSFYAMLLEHQYRT